LRVASEHLADVKYSHGTLEIRFHSGHSYSYYPVPEKKYRDLLAAPSKSEYFRREIKGKYNYQKVAG
jgi:hypothetical protein